MKKNILKYTLLALGVVMLGSCSESLMDDINKKPYLPTDVPARLTILDLIVSTATSTAGADLSLYANVYTELEGGCHGQFFNAETRSSEPIAASTYNNSWVNAYSNILNAKDVIKKCSEGGTQEGGYITLGIAQVMYAVNLAYLTDLFGDVPFKQTAEFDDAGLPLYNTPEVDTQQEAYAEIFTLLDAAIVNLAKTDAVALGGCDPIYAGNGAKWIKAVNGLKARYTMQLLNRSSDKSGDYDKILGYIGNSFASAAEQLSYAYTEGEHGSVNPCYAIFWSRLAWGVSESYIKKVRARGDDRYLLFACASAADLDDLKVVKNGEPAMQAQADGNNFDYSVACDAATMSVHLISYHELLFLKAEALARKGDATAKDAYKAALIAGYENQNLLLQAAVADWGEDPGYFGYLTAAMAEAYFTATAGARFDAAPLKEIMIEKYMNCHGASGESLIAYNDIRRLKAEGGDAATFILLENALNATQFPLRYTYGQSDVSNNPNIWALFGNGQYVYEEPVWWAGGTR